MAVNVEKLFSAGVDSVHAGLLNSTGLFSGQSASISNGGDSGPFVVIGAQSADISIPDLERVNVDGDDGRLGTFLFDSADESNFTFEAGGLDMAVAAATQGTVLRALGDWDVNLIRPGTRTPQQMCWIINSQAKSLESASTGVAGFRVTIIPRLELSYLGPSGQTSRNPHTYRYSAIINPSTTHAWGEALVEGTDGDTKMDAIEFYAENRVTMHAFVGDNSTDTVTLDYTPAGADTTNKVLVWKDGTQLTKTTHYTVNTGTKVLTFTAGNIPDTGEEVVIVYEYTA